MHTSSTHPFPAADTSSPQLTLRAVATGVVLGALLAPCNIYSGLKIGWAFNMSIAAALISFGLWKLAELGAGTRPWGMLENVINQTTASSAAAIVSSGLAAPIPALTLITGRELAWDILSLWLAAVSLLGVVVAVGLRRQMLLRDRLPFASGIATAETVREIYAHGAEAMARVRVLLGAGVVAAALKLVSELAWTLPRFGPGLSIKAKGALAATGIERITWHNLGFALDPSLLMVGFGAIIGMRVGASLLLGAVIAWGWLGPLALARGWAQPGEDAPDVSWFGPMVEWLLWPGVTLMVVASLTAFAFGLGGMLARRAASRAPGEGREQAEQDTGGVPRHWFVAGVAVVSAIAIVAQLAIFGIALYAAVAGVLLTFVLAVVAARVAGETAITPIGAIGKVVQLSFAIIAPGNVTNNLMAANVTGGAAAQCADLLHDLKAGLMLGALPRLQVIAQVFGVLAGSLAGAAAYLVLVPDPQAMLLTPEWPAPAVATWKAVAEVLAQGLDSIPPATVPAMVIAAVVAVILALVERRAPEHVAARVPSAPAMGLAFVIPAWNSISFFIGALLGLALMRFTRNWAERFLLAMAAGLVAGESLAGVGVAIGRFVTGG